MLKELLEMYFKREAIRRLNNNNIISDDTEEDIKETLGFIKDNLDLMGISRIYYKVELKRVADMRSKSVDVHYIITLS